MDEPWQKVLKIHNSKDLGRQGLTATIISSIRSFDYFHQQSGNDAVADLATIEAALQHRSVSVASDEPLLIGTLLDLNVAKILDGPEKTRI